MNLLSALPKSKRHAFTLIELLVIIAIISLLSAILFPVFARARENARRATCQSNLKQISLGITQYTQDYDEKMVPIDADNNMAGGGNGFSWVTLTQPYMKSTQVYNCPSRGLTIPDGQMGLTYTYNHQMGINGGKRLAGISQVAKTPIMLEAIGLNVVESWNAGYVFFADTGVANKQMLFVNARAGGGTTNAEATRGEYFAGAGRHLEMSNYLFADGHVKALRYSPGGTMKLWWGRFGQPIYDAPAGFGPGFPIAPGTAWVPQSAGLDYDGDGVEGTDAKYG